VKVVDGKIYILGRDQITILHDFNGDGEADFYENFLPTVGDLADLPRVLMDLQTDSAGNFYFSTCGNQAGLPLRMNTYGYILKVPKPRHLRALRQRLRAANEWESARTMKPSPRQPGKLDARLR